MITKELLAAASNKDFSTFERLAEAALYNKAALLVESYKPTAISHVLSEADTVFAAQNGSEYTFPDGSTRVVDRDKLRTVMESVPEHMHGIFAHFISENVQNYDEFLQDITAMLRHLLRVTQEFEDQVDDETQQDEPDYEDDEDGEDDEDDDAHDEDTVHLGQIPNHVLDFLSAHVNGRLDHRDSPADAAHKFFNRPATENEMAHIKLHMQPRQLTTHTG